MDNQIIVGVVESGEEVPFGRSWTNEILSDPFPTEMCKFIKLDGTDSKLPVSVILYQYKSDQHDFYADYLSKMASQHVPIVIDLPSDTELNSSIISILGRAHLVTTSYHSVAKLVGRYCQRMFVLGLNDSVADKKLAAEKLELQEFDGHWLWILDSRLSLESQKEKLARLSEVTDDGSNSTLTIVGSVPGLDLPSWVSSLDIPASILRLGGGALVAWLSNYHSKWDYALWQSDEPWDIQLSYRELNLQRVQFVDDELKTVASSSPNEPRLFDHFIHQIQRVVMAEVIPFLGNNENPSSVILSEYGQRGAVSRQTIAFQDYSQSWEQVTKIQGPLVSILIPAYNRPEYLRFALDSALFQTYENIEIIIGDDSTTDDVESLVNLEYLSKYDNIRYWRNNKNKGQYQNDLDLIEAARGEYINILMDDDLLHLDKIRSQMEFFLGVAGKDIGLVTSHRAVVDADGNFSHIFSATQDFFKETQRLSGRQAIEMSLRANRNLFGEPTTVLFRKSMLVEDFGALFDRRYVCNVDHASWLQILQRGDVVFIDEVLSAYRLHAGQQSWTPRAALGGAVDFAHATAGLQRLGYLANSAHFYESIHKCVERIKAEQGKITDVASLDEEASGLYAQGTSYVNEFQAILQSKPYFPV